jgi:hypothetical protein
MPRRKKKPQEWTTEEAMKKLFPKKVRDELHRIAHEKDDDAEKPKPTSP